MREKDKPLSELAGRLKPFPQKLINVRVEKRLPFEERPAIGEAVAKVEAELAGRGRVLLRYSGTESLCRVMNSAPGLGKTHLAQAVGRAIAEERSGARVGYLTAEDFASRFVAALRTHDIENFKTRFRDLDVLLLEDVHFLQGKEKMQDMTRPLCTRKNGFRWAKKPRNSPRWHLARKLDRINCCA